MLEYTEKVKDTVKPGDYVRITKPLNFMGSPVIGAGACALVISIPSWLDTVNDKSLLLVDDRLLTVHDWWLRNNCVVVTALRATSGSSPGPVPAHVGTLPSDGPAE